MRSLIILFTIFLVFAIQNSASAHSGGTDASGGHKCSDTSKAKGLCTGYHSHNGGSDSSGSSSESTSTSSTSSSQSNDKDCTDFASYDEMISYWNAKGYTKDYDPERLDGWGNVVDDGIPCEAPSGYDTTKINGSPAQIAQNEQVSGEEAGYPKGLEDGYANKEENATSNEDSANYRNGYEQGYKEGQSKLNAEKEAAEKAGYEGGLKESKLTIPAAYNNHSALKASFESGYDRAIEEVTQEREEKYAKQGYEDGKNDKANPPSVEEENYRKAYETGFGKGQKELKDSYIEKGFNDAFTMLKYKTPGFKAEKYNQWYKEGFESLTEVLDIQETAYQSGLSGEALAIPEEYVASEEVFTHHYEIGATEYDEIKQKETTRNSVGIGAIILAWLGRRFYVAKKMVA
ncbi:hypothetical protein ABFG93_22025 (plasmid) [Pseudalkalibacillus hwajinpoensis]|uniref:hypothetical protein n=1 Tax=Guptibacillus hwajinpoensis TaxID=208199 RepID=UPI00325BF207